MVSITPPVLVPVVISISVVLRSSFNIPTAVTFCTIPGVDLRVFPLRCVGDVDDPSSTSVLVSNFIVVGVVASGVGVLVAGFVVSTLESQGAIFPALCSFIAVPGVILRVLPNLLELPVEVSGAAVESIFTVVPDWIDVVLVMGTFSLAETVAVLFELITAVVVNKGSNVELEVTELVIDVDDGGFSAENVRNCDALGEVMDEELVNSAVVLVNCLVVLSKPRFVDKLSVLVDGSCMFTNVVVTGSGANVAGTADVNFCCDVFAFGEAVETIDELSCELEAMLDVNVANGVVMVE